MGRMYTITDTAVLFGTAVGDIMQIVAGSGKPIVIYSMAITCQTLVDDETVITLSRFATIGSGGASINAEPSVEGEQADAATILARNTVDATSTENRIFARGMSILAGIEKVWVPEMRPKIAAGGNLVLKSTVELQNSVIFTVDIEFEEQG